MVTFSLPAVIRRKRATSQLPFAVILRERAPRLRGERKRRTYAFSPLETFANVILSEREPSLRGERKRRTYAFSPLETFANVILSEREPSLRGERDRRTYAFLETVTAVSGSSLFAPNHSVEIPISSSLRPASAGVFRLRHAPSLNMTVATGFQRR